MVFPVNAIDGGPHWDQYGNLLAVPEGSIACEVIEAVPLGDAEYLLAECCLGPFSALRLNMGHKFKADAGEDNQLLLKHISVPQMYEHIRCFAMIGNPKPPRNRKNRSSFNNDNPVAQLVHELHGGWEVAGGILTLSIPVEKIQEFRSKIKERNLHLGLGIEI